MKRALATAWIGLLLSACGESDYPLVIVEKGVPGDHDAIEAEHLEAFDWYGEYRKVKRSELADGLTVFIRPEPWQEGKIDGEPAIVAGTYSPGSKLIRIAILGGPSENAFFHELLHREADLNWNLYQEIEEGKESWAHHTPQFLALVTEIHRAWDAEMQEREENNGH